MMPRSFFAALACMVAAHAQAALTVADLRCDWAVNPLGVDSNPPKLAWKLESPDRGARQTAWQVRVASSPEKLAAGRADVWDSGRQDGDTQLQVSYGGRALQTGEQVFWQVRAWDSAGQPSAWSAPAKWTMGVVRPEDWQASWITDPELERTTRSRLGFSTPPVADEHTPKWVVLDLGRDYPIETVGLHAVVHTVNERLGFPRWFKVELSRHADFRESTVIADHTSDPINMWFTRMILPVEDITARYLRLSVPRLRMMEEDQGGRLQGRLALSQIEVRSGGENVAVGAKVTASASLENDTWSAQALVDGLALPAPGSRAAGTLRLRREFDVRAGLERATLFVSGLGHYTLGVNGRGVADEDLLKPGWTEYTKTIFYDTHDLTAHLRAGRNALGLTLASGMYNVPYAPGRYTKFVGPPRALKAIAQLRLEYADGSVKTLVSDRNWKADPGPVTFAHIYGGEDYDASLETPGWDAPSFDDSAWTRAAETAGPGGELRGISQAAPPLRVHETLAPVAVRELRPGVKVYDLGQNTALIPRLRVRGPAGATVKILPSELVHEDGSINPRSTHGSKTEAGWNYRLAGRPGGETWQPAFFYHGARYLQVELTAPDGALPPVVEKLAGFVFHTSSTASGHFATSSDLINRIRQLIRWAQRSNLVHVLTDCPHRERLGWMEQYHLNGPALRCEFDLTRLYGKTFGDMADAQLASGLVPSITPEYVRFDGYFRDSPEWGSAIILAALQQFVWTGDDTLLRRHYEAMQRYFDYLASRAENEVVSHGLGDWYDLGPGHPGVSQLTPIPLVATAIFYEDARAMQAIARHLGRTADAERYRRRAESIAEVFNETFFNPDKAAYATGSQAAQALPLVLGLVPDAQSDAAVANLVQAVRNADNVATAGDVGYRYLLNALAGSGRSDVIFDIINQTEKPGYGYQLAHGATSLTEAWDANPNSSQNHFMLGHAMEWFYQHLAGIAPDPGAPGFGRVIIRPEPVGDLKWVEASVDSVRGKIAVRWTRDADRFHLEVTVPPNVRASVQLPAGPGAAIMEGGRPITMNADVVSANLVNERPAFEIGAGHYSFEVR